MPRPNQDSQTVRSEGELLPPNLLRQVLDPRFAKRFGRVAAALEIAVEVETDARGLFVVFVDPDPDESDDPADIARLCRREPRFVRQRQSFLARQTHRGVA